MDWKPYLDTNPDKTGNAADALSLPSGFVVARGHAVALAAIAWVNRVTVNPKVARPIPDAAGGSFVDDPRLLRSCAEHMNYLAKRDCQGEGQRVTLEAKVLGNGALEVMLTRTGSSTARMVVQPHGPGRGDPTVLVEWNAISQTRDKALAIPEWFEPFVRDHAVAWTEPTELFC